jgi:hypothetical protein
VHVGPEEVALLGVAVGDQVVLVRAGGVDVVPLPAAVVRVALLDHQDLLGRAAALRDLGPRVEQLVRRQRVGGGVGQLPRAVHGVRVPVGAGRRDGGHAVVVDVVGAAEDGLELLGLEVAAVHPEHRGQRAFAEVAGGVGGAGAVLPVDEVVGLRAVGRRRRRAGQVALVLVRVHGHRGADLLHVAEAGGPLTLLAGLREGGHEDRDQQGDDADHDQELDEREGARRCSVDAPRGHPGGQGRGSHVATSKAWIKTCEIVSKLNEVASAKQQEFPVSTPESGRRRDLARAPDRVPSPSRQHPTRVGPAPGVSANEAGGSTC